MLYSQAEERTMEMARLLGVCSYNDFRAHLHLMACTTYEEINPDPKVSSPATCHSSDEAHLSAAKAVCDLLSYVIRRSS